MQRPSRVRYARVPPRTSSDLCRGPQAALFWTKGIERSPRGAPTLLFCLGGVCHNTKRAMIVRLRGMFFTNRWEKIQSTATEVDSPNARMSFCMTGYDDTAHFLAFQGVAR